MNSAYQYVAVQLAHLGELVCMQQTPWLTCYHYSMHDNITQSKFHKQRSLPE